MPYQPVDNLEEARLNRERVKKPSIAEEAFYRLQEHMADSWLPHRKPPDGLVVGELPQANLPKGTIKREAD